MVAAAAIILLVGIVDDTRGMRPRVKLLGQMAAVLVLFAGGIRIDGVVLLGFRIPLSFPYTLSMMGFSLSLDVPSLLITLLWFLGCMNIWNLIDGMDGLASGVGLLVSGTLMLVALHENNLGSAAVAAGLAGSLAGFLLYNWHPACIFLGDSGSLLIGLLIGVIGVQDSLKGTTAVSILFPLLAMGLPISDTMMAIFRRWVRNLPLSSADRRHVHHLLIGLGLNPRQAALLLYSFTAFLCGAVLMGVAWKNDFLALILGLSGSMAFLLILTSRRDELATLVGDLKAKRGRKKQERLAAKETWEAIQRIELCETPDRIWETLARTPPASSGVDALRPHLLPARRTAPVLRGVLQRAGRRRGRTCSPRPRCRARRRLSDSPAATTSSWSSRCTSRPTRRWPRTSRSAPSSELTLATARQRRLERLLRQALRPPCPPKRSRREESRSGRRGRDFAASRSSRWRGRWQGSAGARSTVPGCSKKVPWEGSRQRGSRTR